MKAVKMRDPEGGVGYFIGVGLDELARFQRNGWKPEADCPPLEIVQARIAAFGPFHMVTVGEAARIARVAYRTIRNAVPVIKVEGETGRVMLSDVLEWIQNRRAEK